MTSMPADYYATLIAAWNAGGVPQGANGTPITDGMATADKRAAVNSWTVPGQPQDVRTGDIVAYLAMASKLAALSDYGSKPPVGANPSAVTAARELVTILTTPSIASFRMSDPTIFEAMEGFLAVLVSDTANSGITANDQAALLGLAATTAPWWKSIGLSSALQHSDTDAAGLV
jgi:hypothetical protein